jgi:hypothetical protein
MKLPVTAGPPGVAMITLRRPSREALHAFRSGQAALDFTYPAVGATAGTPPH